MDKLVKKLMNHGFTKARAVAFIGEVIQNYNELMSEHVENDIRELCEGMDEEDD